jgi:serine/threonine protein phosphatase PrpC
MAGWTVWTFAVKGLRHDRMEDAHTVQPNVPHPSGAVHVLGVFDGVGGLPAAAEASQAAALATVRAVANTSQGLAALSHLNEAVLETGGASTAVIAVLEASGLVEVLNVGDGGAYMLGDTGELVQLTPKDQQDAKRLTDHLGWPDCKGHSTRLLNCHRLLLCTDGVDAVVDPMNLRDALANANGRLGLQRLLDAVDSAGRPDDATAILAIRT